MPRNCQISSGVPETRGLPIVTFGFSTCLPSGLQSLGQIQCLPPCPMEDCCGAALRCLTPRRLLLRDNRRTAGFGPPSVQPMALGASVGASPGAQPRVRLPDSSTSLPHTICSSTMCAGENGGPPPLSVFKIGGVV